VARGALLLVFLALAPGCRRERSPKPIVLVPSAAPAGSLDVKLAIHEQGFDLQAPGRPSVVIPKRGADYDFTALARALEGAADGGPEKRTLTIEADPTVAYGTVIATMDAARPTFQDVAFSPPPH
jgi:hypothetical protein